MLRMSAQAVGAYVQELIERRGMTIAAVTAMAGVEANYLWRLRAGKIKAPAAETIGALVRAAHGSYDRALTLLLDPNATEIEGASAAQDFDELAVISRLPPHQRRLVAELARQMLHEELSQ